MSQIDTTSAVEVTPRLLVPSLVFVALVVAAVGSLGAPLITGVAEAVHVSLASAQWTLTITLLTGAVATPVLGRLGAGPHRRATILATLVLVVAGSVLTVLPLPFWSLLLGRAAQGVGLGLTALMMGVARDQLPAEQASATIALVSVASTIGIGIGYPLAGLLTDLTGLRAAYGLGLAIAVLALAAAWRSIPAAPPGRSAHVDLPGAALLATALLAAIYLTSETTLWTDHLTVAVILVVIAATLLAVWVIVECRVDHPLVDLRLLRNPAVAGANGAMFIAGIGMYLLLTLITRYGQTPNSTGYGFGLSTFVAGLILVPFSVLGFVAGKLTPKLRKKLSGPAVLAVSAFVVLAAFVVFATARTTIVELVVAMAILGFGVGSFSSAMPATILDVTPAAETSSAMGVNQVVRSVGFALGSAIGGVILAAGTTAAFPSDVSYTTAAWIGAGITAVAAAVCLALRTRPGPHPGRRRRDRPGRTRRGPPHRARPDTHQANRSAR